MQAVNRGHIIDSCPSSVERPDHNNSENYSLKFLCEAGGLQSIANDISPDERSFKRMNTVKKSFTSTVLDTGNECQSMNSLKLIRVISGTVGVPLGSGGGKSSSRDKSLGVNISTVCEK